MEPTSILISQIDDESSKASIVKEVLLNLPEWFGLEESTQEYIDQSRKLPLLAAMALDEVIGFVTLKETSVDVCEIHCMGIKKEYHRQGIGHQLYKAMESIAKKKYLYIQVKTVDEGRYKEYDQTIAFYRNMGFKKVEVFPTLWDEWNPCLQMIKAI